MRLFLLAVLTAACLVETSQAAGKFPRPPQYPTPPLGYTAAEPCVTCTARSCSTGICTESGCERGNCVIAPKSRHAVLLARQVEGNRIYENGRWWVWRTAMWDWVEDQQSPSQPRQYQVTAESCGPRG